MPLDFFPGLTNLPVGSSGADLGGPCKRAPFQKLVSDPTRHLTWKGRNHFGTTGQSEQACTVLSFSRQDENRGCTLYVEGMTNPNWPKLWHRLSLNTSVNPPSLGGSSFRVWFHEFSE